MSNRDRLETEGIVVDACKGIFRVDVSKTNEPNIVSCTLSGKIRNFSVKILVGDRVTIEVCEYELTKGRIIFRHKK